MKVMIYLKSIKNYLKRNCKKYNIYRHDNTAIISKDS